MARTMYVLRTAALILLLTFSYGSSLTLSTNESLATLMSQRIRRQIATPPAPNTKIVYTWHDESTALRVHTVYLAAEATWVHAHHIATPAMVGHLESFLAVPMETLKHTLVAHEMRQLESQNQYRKWFYTQV